MDIRLLAADTIILLDLPRALCVFRALKRAVQYKNRSRPDMGKGCSERLDADFFGFLKYIWQFPEEKRPGVLQKLHEVKDKKRVVILGSKSAIDGFFDKLK